MRFPIGPKLSSSSVSVYLYCLRRQEPRSVIFLQTLSHEIMTARTTRWPSPVKWKGSFCEKKALRKAITIIISSPDTSLITLLFISAQFSNLAQSRQSVIFTSLPTLLSQSILGPWPHWFGARQSCHFTLDTLHPINSSEHFRRRSANIVISNCCFDGLTRKVVDG